MLTIKNDVLDEHHRQRLCDWIVDSEHLSAFDTATESSDTRRSAFAVTYKSSDLPIALKFLKEKRVNVYNIVAIVTYQSGDIPEHVDDDLTCYMRATNLIPEMYIKHPDTTSVYYVNVCDSMVGGETIFNEHTTNRNPITIGAEQNMMVTFSSNIPHRVNAMECDNPRIVLVCEKYRFLKSAMPLIKTPIYRKG